MFDNKVFYHGSFRKAITIFGSMFDNIYIEDQQTKDLIKVPIHYAQGEKFLEMLARRNDKNKPIKNLSYPTMAYEMIANNYAPERMKNSLQVIKNCSDESGTQYMLNRIPYDIMFELYIATRKMDDSFRIVEQILPYFSPALTVRVNDIPSMNVSSNVIIDITSSSMTVDYEDDMSDVRHILWQLSFTLKTYLYRPVESSTVIQEAIVNAIEKDINGDNKIFGTLTALSDGTQKIDGDL